MTRIAAIDLFAGAGGLSLGAAAAGVDVRAHLDSDEEACDTLRRNHRYWDGSTVLQGDIRHVGGRELRRLTGAGAGDPLLVIGGAPCQPFSKAAYWVDAGEEAAYRRARAAGVRIARPAPPAEARVDERRGLVGEFWRIVAETKADGFLFENVPSILHPRNRHLAVELLSAAETHGYEAILVRANAASFGVAQTRERVFILGTRGTTPRAPAVTHALPKSTRGGARRVKTAGEVIGRYSGVRYFEPEEMVVGRWAEHLRAVPPGGNYKAHTAWGGHRHPTFVTETRFWSFLLKLDPGRPSWTIPANPGPWVGPFHWDNRRLRTPELAALQGFPHGYVFAGARRSRVRQIGNAVPPKLAEVMVGALVEALSERRRRAA